MEKVKTLDGYYVYKIKKEEKSFYLADKNNYKKDIDNLLAKINDIKFDSVIIIFGIDTGEYLKKLRSLLCDRNKVLIFEPNEEVFNANKAYINNDNINLILYDRASVKEILVRVINNINFNKLYVNAFGNYEKAYKEEYDTFIENLDCVYYTASAAITLAYRFKEVFLKNLIANLKILKEATSLNSYENINKDIPAIIVSAGPSLDKNLNDMVKHKKELEKYFVIAGSRTLGAMMKKGIKPDMVVSIDPVDDNYEMMKDYLEEDIPLVFYEYSNRYLIRDYKGKKIFLSSVLVNTIPQLHELKSPYLGGSVAHTCMDIANVMGCSPIILVGQDLAFTYNKYHSDLANFEVDKKNEYDASFIVDDIYGNKVRTNSTLNLFRERMEEYIKVYRKISEVEFINASYGAEIKGAPHKELSEIFKIYRGKSSKKNYIENKCIEIDEEAVLYEILGYIEGCSLKAKKGENLCKELLLNKFDKSLMNIAEDDEDLQKFIKVMEIVKKFETSRRRVYLGGYIDKFLFDIKEGKFNMYAKDYASLTSSLQYQSECFLAYFKGMKEFIIEAKKLIIEILEEFYF